MNVMISDNFAGDFANLGDIASRRVIDTETAANNDCFWVKVQAAFVQLIEQYNNMQFLDNHIVVQQQQMHLDTIFLHYRLKLRSIQKVVNAEYIAALTRFNQLGTHYSNFFHFSDVK